MPQLGPNSYRLTVLLLAALVGLPGWPAAGVVVQLSSSADTTLIEAAPNNNLGAAWFFNAGTTGTQNRNRGLIQFDVAGVIPPDAIINSVQLELEVTRQPSGGGMDSYFALHRVLRPWGEGDKTHGGTPQAPISPGLGSPAGPGDATWVDRFAFSGNSWGAGGGMAGVDYLSLMSADTLVRGVDQSPFTFASTPELVSDVQLWLSQPDRNFGWMLINEAEGDDLSTARSFGSREHPFLAPRLQIDFEPVPEPKGLVLGIVGGVVVLLLRWRFRR